MTEAVSPETVSPPGLTRRSMTLPRQRSLT